MMLRQLFFFSPRKAFGFFFKFFGTGFTPYLCYVLFRGGAGGGYDGKPGFWLRAAERDVRTNRPERTTRSADHTLSHPHAQARSHWSISQHGLHHNQNRRLHGPTRSAIISFF